MIEKFKFIPIGEGKAPILRTTWAEQIEDKINEIIDTLSKPSVPSELEPYNRPPSNHLEVNYIAVGYYKHEIDFGVLCSVKELSDTDFEKMLDMLKTAIRVAREMRERNNVSPSNP